MAQSFALGKNIGLQGQGSLCDQHTTRISTQNVRGPCSMRAQAVAEARHDFFCAILSKILTATSGLKNQARRAKVPPIIPDTRCSFLCSGVR